jgi:uncharacterized protein DUF3313
MNKLLNLSLVMTLLIGVSIPAQAQKVKTKDFSGWLENYETLVYVEDRNAFVFSNEAKAGTYEKVMLQEVSLFGTNVKAGGELAIEASDYLREGILQIFEEEGVLATEPGPKVARLSLAITGVEKSVESMKPRDVIPVAAVFRGAKAATGKLNTYIDVMFEGEATDSVTGERLMAIVTRDYGDTDKKSGDEMEFEDLLPTLDRWLAQYRVTVNEFLAKR